MIMNFRKLFLSLILFSLSINAFALDFFWDFGTAFAGGNVGYDGTIGPEFEADIQVLDFRLESDSGFSFAFSPCNFWCVLNEPEEEDIHLTTFGNFTLAYDIFRFRKNVELMPYVSSYLGAFEGLDKFRVDCGLVFNVYSDLIWPNEIVEAQNNNHLRGEILSTKVGLRLNQYKPQIFASIGFNVIALAMIFFGDTSEFEEKYR